MTSDAAVPPGLAGETPFDCFKRDDLWEMLAGHPDTRPHVADTGFRETIEKLRQDETGNQQAFAQLSMKDPRVMQAMAVLQGWRLGVTEDEIKHAESVGDMKKRDAVQMRHLEVAVKHETVEAAKQAGNEHFKAQQFAEALACYQRATTLQRQAGESEHGQMTLSTLASNAAACLLKLKRPKEALDTCKYAREMAPAGADRGKICFRTAQAHEQLRDFGSALRELRDAKEAAEAAAARAAVSEVDATGGDGRGGGGAGGGAGGGGVDAAVKHMQREIARVSQLHAAALDEERAKREQLQREVEAEALRGAGKALPPTAPSPAAKPAAPAAAAAAATAATATSTAAATAASPAHPWAAGTVVTVRGLQGAAQHNGKRGKLLRYDEGAGRYEVALESGEKLRIKPDNVEHAAAAADGGGGGGGGGSSSAARSPHWAPGYVQETDLSHWSTQYLRREIDALKREPQTGAVEGAPFALYTDGVTVSSRGLNVEQSDIHASVKQKRGARALFYDLSLVVKWHAECVPPGGGGGSGRGGGGGGGGGGDKEGVKQMDGIFRLYNVGQDTKFNPGGDKETSYMYELGFPREHYGQSEPWAELTKAAAADLFDLVAEIVQRWAKELTAKATALG